MNILKITNQNFKEEILDVKEKSIILDFYADWCGPCKMMAPIVDEIANENRNIKVGKLNVDEAQNIAVQYGIMSIPTIIIFKNGKEIKRFIGVTSKDEILGALN